MDETASKRRNSIGSTKKPTLPVGMRATTSIITTNNENQNVKSIPLSHAPSIDHIGGNVKNVNLKSEMIPQNKEKSKQPDHLFVSNNSSTTTINNGPSVSPGSNTNGNALSNTSLTMSSTTTNSGYSTPLLNMAGATTSLSTQGANIPVLIPEDSASIYQNSIYSSTVDNTITTNNNTITNNTVNRKQRKNTEDEEFIYHDDMSVVTGSEYQQGLGLHVAGSGLGLGGTGGTLVHAAPSNDILTPKLPRRYSNNARHTENELDFLDEQSIMTTNTLKNTDIGSSYNTIVNPYSSPSTMKAPQLRASQLQLNSNFFQQQLAPSSQQFQPNMHLKPSEPKATIISQVRKVSQKLFNNNNANHQRIHSYESNSDDHPYNQNSYQPGTLNKAFSLNPIDDYTFDDEDDDLNDAESMLRRPFLTNSPKRDPIDGGSSPHRMGRLSDDPFNQYGSLSSKRDVENLNPFYYNSPHDYKSAYYKQKIVMKTISTLFYLMLGTIFLLGILRVVILKNLDKSLVDFKVTKLDNVLVTDMVLLFEVESNATNVNCQDVTIWDMDLDVFLVTDSSLLKDDPIDGGDDDAPSKKMDLTILLGNSTKFVTPLQFEGVLDRSSSSSSVWSSFGDIWYKLNHKNELTPTTTSAQIKITHPGNSFKYKGEHLTDEQWSEIYNNPFKLVIRGSFAYHLPLMSNYEIINISNEEDVDPSDRSQV